MDRKVLVIDDDASLARLLRVWLTTEGFSISMAQHGAEGLASLEALEPDLILLDLQMPVMDGRTFFKEMRNRGIDIPVIVMSAYGSKAIAQEMGADGFMPKPFEPEVLIELVGQVIDQRERSDDTVGGSFESMSRPSETRDVYGSARGRRGGL